LSHLHKINSSASRMSSLLSDLLHYSTLSDTMLAFESIDLSTVVQNILEDVELLIKEKHAVITTENLPVIHGIPFQINQLFYNLLNNALKFSKAAVPARIHIRCSVLAEEEQRQFPSLTKQPYYKIEVSDNGIGFSQQYAEKIFVVFQRLHLKQQYSGNGIGLSLCKKIVQNHKGVVYAHSIPDEGSTFTVILPVAEK
jgi:light-regulated signal transduction histidine kinase (bacteriophytochrome)